MKKILLIIGIILAVVAFWLFYNRHQAYSLNYNVDGYSITESFDVDKDHYFIQVQKDNQKFETYLTINYSPRRKIITSVEELTKGNLTCIKLNENVLPYPICKQNDSYVAYYSDEINENELKDTYNNIEIYDLLGNIYLVWNYHGFYYINDNKITSINLFATDTYSPFLLTKIKDQLFIADYDTKYDFNKYYLLNFKDAKFKEYTIERKLSVDSYILGQYKNSVYLFDPKEEQEYEINIKKGRIYKTSPKVLVDNVWEKTTEDSLLYKKTEFVKNELFKFVLEDKKLYYVQGDIKVKVSNLNVDTIIEYGDDYVFFIANGVIYYFNLSSGATRIMRYSEWNFNYNNCVFVYNNQ